MNREVRAVLAPLIVQDYFNTHNLMCKYLLAPHILEIQPRSIEDAMLKLQESQSNVY
jgi:hypothetical protein